MTMLASETTLKIASVTPGIPMLNSLDAPQSVVPTRCILTDDPREILLFAAEGAESGYGAALVSLTEIRGGAARAIGAQMAVRGDGAYCGFVSGGCTEAAIAAEAVIAIRNRTDRYLMLGEGSPFFDIVLPCGGGITLAIHVVRDPRVLRSALNQLSRRLRVSLVYNPVANSLAMTDQYRASGWRGGVFTRGYRAGIRLLVSGSGIEASAVSRVAASAGFDVVPIAANITELAADEDTAIALLHHDLDHELEIIPHALQSTAFYVGALGSAKTHQRRCAALRRQGYSDEVLARLRAPIGIIPKARDSATLALSVIADIAAVYAGADAVY